MSKRTFTKEQKLSIFKEASEQGVTKTLKKYGIYPATYYSWKEKLSRIKRLWESSNKYLTLSGSK